VKKRIVGWATVVSWVCMFVLMVRPGLLLWFISLVTTCVLALWWSRLDRQQKKAEDLAHAAEFARWIEDQFKEDQ
jgi:hypothetical protein